MKTNRRFTVEERNFALSKANDGSTVQEIAGALSAMKGEVVNYRSAYTLTHNRRFNAPGLPASAFFSPESDPPMPCVCDKSWTSADAYLLGDPPIGRSALDRRQHGKSH
jgi:hypothetical protein